MNIEKIFQTKSLLITSFIIIISSVYYLNQKWNAYPVLTTAEKYLVARYPRLIPVNGPREGTAQGELVAVMYFNPDHPSSPLNYRQIKDLLISYPQKFYIVFRYIPKSDNSKFIVRVLEAARKQKLFWKAYEYLMVNYQSWGKSFQKSPKAVWDILRSTDIDIQKLKEDMNDIDIEDLIERDLQSAAELKILGDFQFFVNGEGISNKNAEQLKQLIQSRFMPPAN